jgi:carbamate kinase
VKAVEETCKHIADMIERGWNVIVTHGNGPQVGFILRRNELAAHEVHSTPLDVIGADTQGAIGYMIARRSTTSSAARHQAVVAAVVTQVLVDRERSGLQEPDQGHRRLHDQGEGRASSRPRAGWCKEDAGRGWRRMIASPIPKKIVEIDAIKTLIATASSSWAWVAAASRWSRTRMASCKGVFAVIDKDRASACWPPR